VGSVANAGSVVIFTVLCCNLSEVVVIPRVYRNAQRECVLSFGNEDCVFCVF